MFNPPVDESGEEIHYSGLGTTAHSWGIVRLLDQDDDGVW